MGTKSQPSLSLGHESKLLHELLTDKFGSKSFSLAFQDSPDSYMASVLELLEKCWFATAFATLELMLLSRL